MFIAKYNLAGVAQFAKGFGGPGSDAAFSIAVDSTGVYVTGSYNAITVIDLGNGVTLPVTGAFSHIVAAFIIKYNLEGVAQWAKGFGGSGAICYAVAVDSTGIYVTGRYNTNSVNLGNGVTLPNSEIGVSGILFVIKYNLSGVAQWAKAVTGQNSNSIGNGITVDSTGVYVIGSYFSTPGLNLGSGVTLPISVGGGGNSDIFIVKYNLAGVPQWATTIGGTSTDTGSSIAVDSTSVYVTGSYTSTSAVSLGNGITLPISTSASQDAFVAKYNLAGVAQWANGIGSTQSDSGNAIAVDPTGVYVSGVKSTSTSINLGNGVTIAPSGGCIIKYDLAGVAQWAKGGVGSSITGIALDSTGVYTAGHYSSGTNLGNGVTLPTPVGGRDAVTIKHNLTGVAQWATAIKGTGWEDVYDIAVDPTGVYVTGSYTSTSAVIL